MAGTQTTDESSEDPAPLFHATITPHRSLAPSGARLVVVLCCLAAVGSSIPFIVLGAWPVAGFLGLDILALAIAFKASFRSAKGFEEVVLTPIELMLRRVTHRGERTERRFNPLWTKLDREHDEDFGLMALALVSRGERVVIARELSPPERETFADAFGEALARAKKGL
ncbi:DUF2244 domain-containing protein [Salinarimonas ramus]|uniref:Membrane protein n=1 Tax=Salinarimonas ramus TaxID=690164 RepID=A0A917QFE4_9HYPH|nr:DUF2244 domain-containing protein [Salinarimonas ramus]GGK47933.1 membrane protein [Salinarimonas ramus]